MLKFDLSGTVCIHVVSKMFQAKFLLLALVATSVTAEYTIESRIVQGHDAARGQFPFYVFLESEIPQGLARCGGSLISNEWILTSGLCVKSASETKAHLGSLRVRDTKEEGRKIFTIRQEDIHVHPWLSTILVGWK